MADDQTPSDSGSDQITEPQVPDFDTGDGRVPGQAYVRVDTSAAAGVASTLSNIPVYGQSTAQGGAASVITTTGISDLDAALQSIGAQAVWRLAADDDTAPAVAAADTTGDSGTGADAAGRRAAASLACFSSSSTRRTIWTRLSRRCQVCRAWPRHTRSGGSQSQ